MNIGIDIKAFKNGKTGISRYLRNLLDWLQRLDTTNRYYLFECTSSEYPVFNPLWKKVLLPWKFTGILWQQCILPRHLKRYHIDILWAPEQICPVFYKGTIVTTVFDITALRYPETCQPSNRLIQNYLFPRTLKHSTRLLPISDFIGNELGQIFPKSTAKKITVIACGSPDWKLMHEPRTHTTPPVVFFAGNREPRKNLVRLVDALELLLAEGFPVSLHLAGPPGWKNSRVDDKILNGPLRNHVSFLGYLSEEALMEQYRNCAAVVYPSVYEGFGLPVLEALCMGARVITSRGTVMEEVAQGAARYFDPFDHRDIARAIRETLSEPLPAEHDFALYRERLAQFSWEKSTHTLMHLFEECREEQRSPPW